MFIIYGNKYIIFELFSIFVAILSIFTELSTLFMETYFSKNAKKLLKDKGLTQSEFCIRLGYKKSSWENIVKTTDLKLLAEIADLFEMSLEDIIGFEKRKFTICGFVKIDDTIYEIESEDDIRKVLKKVEALEGYQNGK